MSYSEDLQYQLLAEAIIDGELSHQTSMFTGNYKKVANIINMNDSKAKILKGLQDYALIDEDLDVTVQNLLSYKPKDTRFNIPNLDDIDHLFEPITWLWHKWIPNGFPCAFLADAGAGKTTMALDLAMRICNNRPMPDGSMPNIRTGNVVWVDGEGFMRKNVETIREWSKSGLYPDKLKFFPLLREDGKLIDMNHPKVKDYLLEINHAKKPDLIVIDSWDTISVDNTFKTDVQDLLGFIQSLVEMNDSAVMILTHPHKRPFARATDPMNPDNIAGSRLTKALMRVIMGLWFLPVNGKEPHHSHPRLFSMIKNNLKWPDNKYVVEAQRLHPVGMRLNFTEYDESLYYDEDYDRKVETATLEDDMEKLRHNEDKLRYKADGAVVLASIYEILNLKYGGKAHEKVKELAKKWDETRA